MMSSFVANYVRRNYYASYEFYNINYAVKRNDRCVCTDVPMRGVDCGD